MWRKVHPDSMRVGIVKPRLSERFSSVKKQSSSFFLQDMKIRKYVNVFFWRAWIAKILIKNTSTEWEIVMYTSKSWLILGKDGEKIQAFKNYLKKNWISTDFRISVKEIKTPELSSQVMAEYIATQIEARVSYRKVCKAVLWKVMESNGLWVKIYVWWRLWWAEIARAEKFIEWRIPLQTIRADIDYTYHTANTKYWVIWIKVRIYKWDIFNQSSSLNKNNTI